MIFHYAGMAGCANKITRLGVTGVDLFFMVSGFVIYLSLSRIRSGSEFILGRFFRLYPSYIIMLSLTLIAIAILSPEHFPAFRVILANVTILQPLFAQPYIDDSYWTLTVEIQFYILMLLVYLFNWLANMEWIGIIFMVATMTFYLAGERYFPASKAYILPRSVFPVIGHFPFFFAGILFNRIRQDGYNIQRFILLLCCFSMSIYLFDKSGRAHFFLDREVYVLCVVGYYLIFILLIREKLGVLSNRVLVFLGSISYCIYLIHQQTGKLLYASLRIHHHFAAIPTACLVALLMIGVATVVTYGIEKPVRRLKKRMLAVILSRLERRSLKI